MLSIADDTVVVAMHYTARNLTFFGALLVSMCPAQEPVEGASKKPALVLAPGTIDVRAVIRQVGKHLGKKYEIEKLDDLDESIAAGLSLALQNPVRIDTASCEAVLSQIAAARGLMLLSDGRRWVLARGPNRKLILQNPRKLDPAQVLDPATSQMFVTTDLKVKGKAMKLSQQMRPFLTMPASTLLVRTIDVDTVRFTGLRHELIPALQIANAWIGKALDVTAETGVLKALLPPQARGKKKAPSFELKAGFHDLPVVLGKMARILGSNHLFDAEALSSAKIDVESTIVVDAGKALEIISRHALQCGVIMVPLAAAHGIYEWIPKLGKRADDMHGRVLFVSPAGAQRLKSLHVPVMTAYSLGKRSIRTAVRLLRPRAPRGVTMGSVGTSTLLLSGSSADVAAMIELLRDGLK